MQDLLVKEFLINSAVTLLHLMSFDWKNENNFSSSL